MPEHRARRTPTAAEPAVTAPSDELTALRARVVELEAAQTDRSRAAKVQDALYRIADSASAVRNMAEFYPAIQRIVGELMYADNFYIALYDQERQLMNYPYMVDEVDTDINDPELWEPIGTGQARGTTAYVLRTGRPALITNEHYEELVAQGEVDRIGGQGGEDWLGVPLIAEGRTLGVLVVQTYEMGQRYSEEDVELLAFVGQHVATALSRVRAVEETRRRNAELAVVNSVQAGLAAELDMQAMYDLVGDKIAEIFDTHVADIATYDRETDLLQFPYGIERGVRLYDEPRPAFGFRRHVLETGQPLLIEDLERQAGEYGNPLTPMSGEPAKSLVFAPLISGGHPIGVVSLQNLDRERAFGRSDLELLATLTASLGVALENARLIDETRRRAAELAIVNSVGQALASHLDLDALIAQLGDQLVDTFAADVVYVALHDPETGLIEFPYYSENGEHPPQPPLTFGEGLTSRILRSREPLLLNQDAQFEAIGTRGVGVEASSYLGVPIMVGDEAIGVISVQSSRQVGRFGEADTRLLATLAANVGIAIQNARLYRAQQEGERQYRRLVEELPLVLYTDKPDATSTSIYISPQVETMFGYPRSAWMEEPFFGSIVHPDDRERVMGQIQMNLDDPDARERYLYRIIAADGRVVWIRDDVWVVRDENGQPLHIQGFMMDVTEQTLAAAEIRRQKQYFESLVEISPVAIVTMDRGEIVSGWNPAATKLFGYRPDEAIGRPIDDLLFQPEGREEGRAATRQADETGRAQLIGRRFRQDGEPVDVEIVLVPLVIDGEHTGYYAIYHDITELEAARAAAEAANQAKSTFLAAMSHEIRTPMNAIIGMSGLLLDTPLSEDQRDYAETITTSGEALLTIINDILDFSKIEAGRIELEATAFALGACVEGALDVIAPLAAKKGIELAYALDPEIPSVIVGDGGRLRQIVLNLLSNATKFTEQGEVVLRVTGRQIESGRSPVGPGRWEIVAEVRDTGIGIPDDRIGRLFQSFSQADVSIARRYGGTGLGLAISRRLAELMDGSLVAESSGVEGEGSVFRLTIRVDAASVLDLAPARSGPLPELVGRRALVVDDNATNRQILVAQTARWGIASRDTASPLEALRWLEAGEAFDLALIDLVMPEMDGYALAERIRATVAGAKVPIVILSSVGSRDRESPAVAAFLTKPVKPSALHDAVMTVLHGDERAPSVRMSERPSADRELGRRHPLRILLAEDNAVNQKLAIRLLAQMGYTADVAGNGLEAIAALERSTYDVILMDVQMPELDGLGTTRRIRSGDGPARDVWIVAMTANALAGDREAYLAAGMSDYVSKPIRPAELAAALAASPSPGASDA